MLILGGCLFMFNKGNPKVVWMGLIMCKVIYLDPWRDVSHTL